MQRFIPLLLSCSMSLVPGCDDPEADVADVKLVTASGDFDTQLGILKIAVSPTDDEGNFVGHGLTKSAFAFTDVQMAQSTAWPIPLATSVVGLEVDAPRPGAGMTAVVVFDSSGSMADNDPGALGRREGARVLFDELAENDSVALLDFGAGATGPLSASRLLQDFTSDTRLLASALDRLTESGQTPLYESLIDAIGLLLARGQGGVVVVLTDGQDNSAVRPSEVIDLANQQGVQIFAVGLGGQLDFTDLYRLANDTGGGFVEAGNAIALEQTFGGITAGLKVGRVTVIGNARYPEGVAPSHGLHQVTGTLRTLDTFVTPFQFTVEITE